jgi:CyaY protein
MGNDEYIGTAHFGWSAWVLVARACHFFPKSSIKLSSELWAMAVYEERPRTVNSNRVLRKKYSFYPVAHLNGPNQWSRLYVVLILPDDTALVMPVTTGYTNVMLDESTFRRECDRALESLKQSLIRAEEQSEAEEIPFETEEKNGVLNVLFEHDGSKFVFTPNTPVRQIWISALTTSFKLDWDEATSAFRLSKTGEDLRTLTERLLREHTGDQSISLT